MDILINKTDNVVIDIGSIKPAQEGFEVTSGYFSEKTLYLNLQEELTLIADVIVPDGAVPSKFIYQNGNFEVNQNYKEYENPEKKIESLEKDIQGLQNAITELTMLMAEPQ
ncbi:hypothetical protein SAMN02745945_01830 [Peptoclostridium litorale DSM 5388]|uniref:Uncharacterized protein n=1 Tax=Peptoclostridium litorale DSM 5388 TaxID=1121324 RepID=A0A069RFU7_PEPLI|nr:hypothetical protein [Peptoclostridium litorale]KDR95896.1 hypothetical protein CLIT_8c00650 [Peptoclostridium litorale DSM 5388]SIO10460.1 hypothetical protein SAMN02745945_01830 [Peptoclostridium litorale DSM 5388]